MWILSFPASWLSDYTLKKGASRGIVRKVSNTVAHWGPAVALACMSIIPTDDYIWAVVILIIAVGLNAGSLCGFQINHIDLSPNYAGTLMSITNCVATITSIIAPIICSEIVADEVIIFVHTINIIFQLALCTRNNKQHSKLLYFQYFVLVIGKANIVKVTKKYFVFQSSAYQWNIVFYVAAAIYFMGNLIFVICGTGEVQWWNNSKEFEIRRQKEKKDIKDETQI